MEFTRWDLEDYGDQSDMTDEEYEHFNVEDHFEKNGYVRVGSTDHTDSDASPMTMYEIENALKDGRSEFCLVTRGCDESIIEFWVK